VKNIVPDIIQHPPRGCPRKPMLWKPASPRCLVFPLAVFEMLGKKTMAAAKALELPSLYFYPRKTVIYRKYGKKPQSLVAVALVFLLTLVFGLFLIRIYLKTVPGDNQTVDEVLNMSVLWMAPFLVRNNRSCVFVLLTLSFDIHIYIYIYIYRVARDMVPKLSVLFKAYTSTFPI